ncbi:M56 family metallopeptidase [Actinoplanes sp. NPDC049802]|uniref:M56 family metallopeptidase n=1 Tax=Actinoplanes sp. NPDC049802 TaxID=3154742 RepID=UPI0033EC1A45
MTVLVVTGTFVGTLMFVHVFGAAWLAGIHECHAALDPSPPTEAAAFAQQQRFLACSAPLEHRRAAAAIGGGATVLALAVGLTLVLPRVFLWRLGKLRPAPSRWPAAMDRIAPAFFLTTTPRVWLGPSELLEPFTVQRGRVPEVIVPAGARRATDDELAAILGHEAAHVAAGDVRLVWLTRGLRWALPIVAVLPLGPVAVWLVTLPDLTSLPWPALWTWLEYVLRTVVLLVAAGVLAARISRAREHEADAATAAAGGRAGLAALLGSRPADVRLPFRQRITAAHPSYALRRRFIDRPDRLPPYGWPDEMVAGLLATTVLATSYQVTNPGLVGTPVGGWVNMIDSLLAGALIATTCGLSWWHRAHQDPGKGRQGRRPVLAMLAGVPIGMLTAVGQTRGDGPSGWYINWWTLVTVPLAVAAATAVSVCLAHSWAPRRRRPGRFVPVVVNTVLFGLAFWIGSVGAITFTRNEPAEYLLIATVSPWSPFLAVAFGVAAVFAWRLSSRRWLLLATAAGAIGAATVARLLAPRPLIADAPHADGWIDLWSAAAAGLAVVLAVMLLTGAESFTGALYASLVATVGASAAFYLHGFGDWAFPMARAWYVLIYPPAVLGTGVLAVALLLPLLSARHRPAVPPWLLPPAAALLSGAMTTALTHVSSHLRYTAVVFT